MDYLQKIKDQEKSRLSARMDDDRDLLYLKKYILTDLVKTPVDSVINITLNDPAVFAANVIAGLGNVSFSNLVETEDKDIDTTTIEDFQRAFLGAANMRLRKSGRPELDPFFDEQLCIRGRGAYRCTVRMKDDVLIPDVTPLDTRYFYYGEGVDGLEWAAVKYTRSKEAIEAEYGVTVSGKEGVVIDLWDKEVNMTWVDGAEKRNEPSIYGYPPFGMHIVSLGSMLWDADAIERYGESIFFLIRDIIPEYNRLASILQTINMKKLNQALLWKSQQGQLAKPPKYKDITAMSAVTSADIGGGTEAVLVQEAEQSAIMIQSMFETRMQRGGISNFDLGIMGNQPWSAVSLIQIGEGRDQIFTPRLKGKSALNEGLLEMATKQIIALGFPTVDLGTSGHKRSFNLSKLEGEYETIVKYFVKSPETDIARMSVAAAAGELIPDRAKRVEILQREDPDGDERQLRWEEAERLSPAIKMFRTIKSLVEQDNEDATFEANLMAAEMGMTLEAVMRGELPQTPEPREAQKPMLPLMGEGARGRQESGRRGAELQAKPREAG